LLNSKLKNYKSNIGEWRALLKEKSEKNLKLNQELMSQKTVPMTYYNSMGVIKNYIPKDTILIGEGANTMDIGRTIFQHD